MPKKVVPGRLATLPRIGGINVTISREIGENEIVKHKL